MLEEMGEQKRILVVDDDKQVLFVLLHSLMTLGSDYQVVTVDNGLDALDQVRHARFDLMITDLGMPWPDGVHLTELVRSISPSTVVVWITAYARSAFAAELERLNVFRCLEKPVEVAQIRQVARQALQEGPSASLMSAG